MLKDIEDTTLDKRTDVGQVKTPKAKSEVTIKTIMHNLNECSYDYMDYKLPKREADFIIGRETAVDYDGDGARLTCPTCGASVDEDFINLVYKEIRYCYHCGQRLTVHVVSATDRQLYNGLKNDVEELLKQE